MRSSVRDAMLAAVPSLRAFAISLCGNVDRADDLVQGNAPARHGEHRTRFSRARTCRRGCSRFSTTCFAPNTASDAVRWRIPRALMPRASNPSGTAQPGGIRRIPRRVRQAAAGFSGKRCSSLGHRAFPTRRPRRFATAPWERSRAGSIVRARGCGTSKGKNELPPLAVRLSIRCRSDQAAGPMRHARRDVRACSIVRRTWLSARMIPP